MQGRRLMRPAGSAVIETHGDMPGKQWVDPEHGWHCNRIWHRQGVTGVESTLVDSILKTGIENKTYGVIDATTDNNIRGRTRRWSRNNSVSERHLAVYFYIVQRTARLRLAGTTITCIFNFIGTFLRVCDIQQGILEEKFLAETHHYRQTFVQHEMDSSQQSYTSTHSFDRSSWNSTRSIEVLGIVVEQWF